MSGDSVHIDPQLLAEIAARPVESLTLLGVEVGAVLLHSTERDALVREAAGVPALLTQLQELRALNDEARQALWDMYRILGHDTDGDETPAARVNLCDSMRRAAQASRDDYEEVCDEAGQLESEKAALLTQLADFEEQIICLVNGCVIAERERDEWKLQCERTEQGWDDLLAKLAEARGERHVALTAARDDMRRMMRAVCNEYHGGEFTNGRDCDECQRTYPAAYEILGQP